MSFRERNTGPLLVGTAALLIISALFMVTTQNATASPKFAKDTGKACTECHQDPKGGAKLTPFGAQFKANGNKLPTKSE